MSVERGAAAINDAMVAYLQAHCAAWGTDRLKPKHHWMMDIAAQVRRDGVVLDAFVIERTHLAVKAIAEHVKDTRRFERSVMSGMMSTQLQHNKLLKLDSCGLCVKVTPLPGHPGVMLASKLAIWTFEISVGDLVAEVAGVGQVTACASAGGNFAM